MTDEFPKFPNKFNLFIVTPETIKTNGQHPWTVRLRLQNHSSFNILFKVKCTCNQRIKLINCVDVLASKEETFVEVESTNVLSCKDQLCVVYTLVGNHWLQNRNASEAWKRAESQMAATRSIVIKCE